MCSQNKDFFDAEDGDHSIINFLSNLSDEWRKKDIIMPDLEHVGQENLIPLDFLQPWIEQMKNGILAPFLKLQKDIEDKGLIPLQPRNTKLYEYTPGEIAAIESGEMIQRVHAIVDMRCNHNCVHCSRGILASDPAQGKGRFLRVDRQHNSEIAKQGIMIPTAALIELVREGSKVGENGYPQLREISLDGGEPLLDWNRIETILNELEVANQGRDLDKMMRLQIYTNGSTLTAEQIDRLASLPFTYLTINYIARNQQIFDWFTDTPGSYEKVTNNLEALVTAGKKYGRERWLMGALVPIEENKDELIPTIEYLWDNDITPIVQPMRIKERGEINVKRDLVHPLTIPDHLKFLIECWLWSLNKYLKDSDSSEGRGWLWRLDQIFPPNDPSLKKRQDPLRYPFEYTSFIKLFKENRPSYQMLMKWNGEEIDWTFGEYGTALVDGSEQFTKIGHSWQILYKMHREGALRYDANQATTMAKADYPVRHGLKGTSPANLGEQIAK